jgi:hypothetical protein
MRAGGKETGERQKTKDKGAESEGEMGRGSETGERHRRRNIGKETEGKRQEKRQ